MKVINYIVLGGLIITLLACSKYATDTSIEDVKNTPETSLEETPLSDSVVFVISTNGGCLMMGPNCPRYELKPSGSFKVYRGDDAQVATTGKLKTALINQWLDVVGKTDFDQLRAGLGAGECRACFDGIDMTYTIFPNSQSIIFASNEHEFSESEEFFKVSEILMRTMALAAPLEIKSR